MGVDSTRFLSFFQRVNRNKNNRFSIVIKRDCHLSHFSGIACSRDCDSMPGICIKELFFRA